MAVVVGNREGERRRDPLSPLTSLLHLTASPPLLDALLLLHTTLPLLLLALISVFASSSASSGSAYVLLLLHILLHLLLSAFASASSASTSSASSSTFCFCLSASASASSGFDLLNLDLNNGFYGLKYLVNKGERKLYIKYLVLQVSSSISGKEHIKAAYSDLEKIRKLRKEAEFLEASFRAKADSLQQGVGGGQSQTQVGDDQEFTKGKSRKNANARVDRSKRNVGKSRGFLDIIIPRGSRKSDLEADDNHDEQSPPNVGIMDQESNEFRRFETLRKELMELEKRVEISTYQ
nr:uncharacterized protein LOC112776936 [Arachis hypogaea]